jgi:hypothetical protein
MPTLAPRGTADTLLKVRRDLAYHHEPKKGTTVETMTFIILIGVALIDAKLWKIMKAQRAHARTVEALLSEIRDKTGLK